MAEPAAPPNEDVRAALVKLKGQAQEWTMSEDAKLEACMAAIQSRLEQRSGRLERRLAEQAADRIRRHSHELGGVVVAQEIVEVDCARVALVPVVQHADRAPPPRQVGQVVAHAALPVLALDQLVRARVLALQLLAL